MAQVRVLKQKIKATQSTQKLVKAQELIATSRIAKSQARVLASTPYANQITDVLTALATASSRDHPLLAERENARRIGILLAQLRPRPVRWLQRQRDQGCRGTGRTGPRAGP